MIFHIGKTKYILLQSYNIQWKYSIFQFLLNEVREHPDYHSKEKVTIWTRILRKKFFCILISHFTYVYKIYDKESYTKVLPHTASTSLGLTASFCSSTHIKWWQLWRSFIDTASLGSSTNFLELCHLQLTRICLSFFVVLWDRHWKHLSNWKCSGVCIQQLC